MDPPYVGKIFIFFIQVTGKGYILQRAFGTGFQEADFIRASDVNGSLIVHGKGTRGFVGDTDFVPGDPVVFHHPALVGDINNAAFVLNDGPVLGLVIVLFPGVIAGIFYAVVSFGGSG